MRDLIHRPRRLRGSELMRRMVRETVVTRDDLLFPLFVTDEPVSTEIASMPGVYRLTLDDLCRAVERVAAVGLPGVMLFGIPAEKDDVGSAGYAENGIIA